MDKVRLGNSELNVSRLTMGCWCFGSTGNDYWGAQDEDCHALMREAIECGVNYFDTAFAYNNGAAEIALGETIKGGLRDKVIICNKIPLLAAEDVPTYEKQVSDSLKRLNVDYVDVLLMHWPCNDKDLLRRNLEQLQRMKELGLARYIGVSNFGVGQMEIARDMGVEITVNEIAYNLLHRGAELAVLPYTVKHNIGVMAYMPLMQGILTGKYGSLEEIPMIRRRTLHFSQQGNDQIRHGGLGMEAALEQFLIDLRKVSEESGIRCGDLCIAWLLIPSEKIPQGAFPTRQVSLANFARGQRNLQGNLAAQGFRTHRTCRWVRIGSWRAAALQHLPWGIVS